MPGPLGVVLPLVLASVLIASALAKLRTPDDLDGWAAMGVPRPLRARWLLVVHPWGELALGAALALLGGFLGAAAAIVATLLMAAYLWLVAALRRRRDDATCACFGARAPVTVMTVIRNAWLLLVAIGTVASIPVTPLWGGPLVAADPVDLAVAGVVAVTAVLILWPTTQTDQPSTPTTPLVPAAGSDEEALEYVRLRTPAVPVTLADGRTVNLRKLAARRPVLLLAVSGACSSCAPVLERVADWRSLLPELDIRLLVQREPGSSPIAEHTEPQSLHDPGGYVRGSIAEWTTPAAVLLGSDGLLAGGPELGYEAISRFVADIRETLDEHLGASTTAG